MSIFGDDLKNSILKYFQIENASPQRQEKFLQSIDRLGNEVSLSTILDSLTENDCLIFLKLCEDGDDDKALQYARLKIPNLDTLVAQEISKALQELEQ